MWINSVSDCFHPELFNRMERMHGGSGNGIGRGIGKATRNTAHRDRSLVAAADTDDYIIYYFIIPPVPSDRSFSVCSLQFLMCKKKTTTHSIIGNDWSGCLGKALACKENEGMWMNKSHMFILFSLSNLNSSNRNQRRNRFISRSTKFLFVWMFFEEMLNNACEWYELEICLVNFFYWI